MVECIPDLLVVDLCSSLVTTHPLPIAARLLGNFQQIYCRSGFECVIQQLRIVLYKPCHVGSDSNDCELPSGQATLARRVACCEAACGVGLKGAWLYV